MFKHSKTKHKQSFESKPTTSFIVVGDIHGDINQLIYPLKQFLSFKSTNQSCQLIYLGDYIDRGELNIPIFEFVSVLKDIPDVHCLLGNHDCYNQSVFDYFIDKENNHKFIQSLAFQCFQSLNLPLFYYVPSLNIVFSHGPLNRHLNDIIEANRRRSSFNDHQLMNYTYTHDSSSKIINKDTKIKYEFRNIHGHDHRGDDNETIKRFAKDKSIQQISIDWNSSYGFDLVDQYYSFDDKTTVDMTKCKSKVKYIIISAIEDSSADAFDENDISQHLLNVMNGTTSGKISKITIESKTIKVGSTDDYNTKDLNDVVDDVIKELPLMSDLRKELRCINYDKSIEVFKKEYQKQFHHAFSPNELLLRNDLRKLNKENIDLKTYNKDYTNIYFHDIPKDMYKQMGLKIDDNYKTINDVYWRFFISDEEMKDEHDGTSLVGGDKESFDDEIVKKFRAFEQVLYILLVIVVMVVIIGVINDVLKRIVVNKNVIDINQ